MKEIKAIVKRVMLDKVIDSLQELPHLPGITMSMVYGFTRNDPGGEPPDLTGEAKMAKLEVVVPDVLAEGSSRPSATRPVRGEPGTGRSSSTRSRTWSRSARANAGKRRCSAPQ